MLDTFGSETNLYFLIYTVAIAILFIIIMFLYSRKITIKTIINASFIFYLLWVCKFGFGQLDLKIKYNEKYYHQFFNFLFLFPLGFYISYFCKINYRKLHHLIFFFILIPLTIEILQFIIQKLFPTYAVHFLLIDDVIFNVLGYLTGFASGVLIRRLFQKIPLD